MAGRGAIFFDRDGTLNHDSSYLKDPDEVVLLPGVKETLAALKERYRLFLFTNQSGVARGYFGIEDVEAVNERLFELLGGNLFDGICIAVEHPDDKSEDVYRKPSPRFINEMAEKFDIDKSCSYMIGDRKSDLEAGLRAGIGAIRVSADIDDAATAEYCRERGIPTAKNFCEILDLV